MDQNEAEKLPEDKRDEVAVEKEKAAIDVEEVKYYSQLKALDVQIEDALKRIHELSGIKESDTGLAPPSLWNLAADRDEMSKQASMPVGPFHDAQWGLTSTFIPLPSHAPSGSTCDEDHRCRGWEQALHDQPQAPRQVRRRALRPGGA
jgi:hypothetical protein